MVAMQTAAFRSPCYQQSSMLMFVIGDVDAVWIPSLWVLLSPGLLVVKCVGVSSFQDTHGHHSSSS